MHLQAMLLDLLVKTMAMLHVGMAVPAVQK